MQKQQKCHNNLNDIDCDNRGLGMDYADQYISECCFCCGEELSNIDDIRVGVDDDRYYCLECAKENNIEVVSCRDLD